MSSSRGVIWDRPERAARGPAPSLSREQITTAAVTLADTQGIEAVSMRAMAAELGVGAASLYRYVARKDELIDLMVDAVMGSDLQFEVRGDWREDLRSFAHGLRAMTLRHPWMAVPSAGLRNFVPNTARCYEQVLSAIDGLGLEIDEAERLKRTAGVSRLAEKPSRRDLDASRHNLLDDGARYQLNSGGKFDERQDYLRINNTHLTPARSPSA